jgi:hypothetical protein
VTYVVCPVCHDGRAIIVGWYLVCPNGHKFKLRLVKQR